MGNFSTVRIRQKSFWRISNMPEVANVQTSWIWTLSHHYFISGLMQMWMSVIVSVMVYRYTESLNKAVVISRCLQWVVESSDRLLLLLCYRCSLSVSSQFTAMNLQQICADPEILHPHQSMDAWLHPLADAVSDRCQSASPWLAFWPIFTFY